MPDLQNKAKILLSYFSVYFFNKKNNKIKSGIVVDVGSASIQETDGRVGSRAYASSTARFRPRLYPKKKKGNGKDGED